MPSDFCRWLDALVERHVRPLGQPAFLKAVRALSARYVEQRQTLATRSPLDSAGKRAAFAAFFAPLHFLTAREVAGALGLDRQPIDRVVDLGCGTGAAGAAWASSLASPPKLAGVDVNRWAVEEANWNWRTLGLAGRARRGDLVAPCARMLRQSGRASRTREAIVLGWAVNELDAGRRRRLLPMLLELSRLGAAVLVLEPIARHASPWWDEWAGPFAEAGGHAADWKFDVPLPPRLAELDRAAGFRREGLTARSLSIGH